MVAGDRDLDHRLVADADLAGRQGSRLEDDAPRSGRGDAGDECDEGDPLHSLKLLGNAKGRIAAALRGALSSGTLLHLDGGACLLELGLDRVGLLLVHALLDGRRSAVDEVLRLLEAEAGDGAYDLDHLDLLLPCAGEYDVEGGLLLHRGAVACRSATRGGHGDGRRGGDAPLVLDLLLQLDQLEHRHAPELLEDGVNCRHRSLPPGFRFRWVLLLPAPLRPPAPGPPRPRAPVPPRAAAPAPARSRAPVRLPRRRAGRFAPRSARTGSAAGRSRGRAAGSAARSPRRAPGPAGSRAAGASRARR